MLVMTNKNTNTTTTLEERRELERAKLARFASLGTTFQRSVESAKSSRRDEGKIVNAYGISPLEDGDLIDLDSRLGSVYMTATNSAISKNNILIDRTQNGTIQWYLSDKRDTERVYRSKFDPEGHMPSLEIKHSQDAEDDIQNAMVGMVEHNGEPMSKLVSTAARNSAGRWIDKYKSTLDVTQFADTVKASTAEVSERSKTIAESQSKAVSTLDSQSTEIPTRYIKLLEKYISDDKKRDIFVRYTEGDSGVDIAEDLGCTKQYVSKVVREVRTELLNHADDFICEISDYRLMEHIAVAMAD